MIHIPVLLKEVINGLDIKDNDLIVDATFGAGGHSKEMLGTAKNLKIIAIDQDNESLKNAIESINSDRITPIIGNFRNIDSLLTSAGIGSANKILADIGFSSDQMDESKRGFSFQRNEPLLMTMKNPLTENDLTAKSIVNEWEFENIFTIIKHYGEERYARKIAQLIIEKRKEKPIETTYDLVQIIESAVPASYKRGRIHPATRTFQAIRIAVNDELMALKELLEKSLKVLSPEGRIAVISFHSLEDRIVKETFKKWKSEEIGLPITKKPITATDEEIQNNPRARSAKLRIFKKK